MLEEYDCLMPAAGESSRMGAWKPSMRLGNETVAERSVRNALAFCSRVILVTGYRGAELGALFADWRSVVVIENTDFRHGMFSSIRAGVRLVRSQRFFVALADMPFLPPRIFPALAELLDKPLRTDLAARPFYRGRPGHPVLLPSTAIDKVLQFDNSHSMRDVLRGLQVSKLDTDEEGVVLDIDTPEDARRYGLDR